MANTIHDIIRHRILVLDGATGTMIQRYRLTEQDFRTSDLTDHTTKLAGNNDLLCLSRPDVVTQIHRAYLEAGADIITTNSFNAQAISQSEYHTETLVRPINLAAAKIARAEAERMMALTPEKPRFVAGSIGPTGKTTSLSPDVENPALRSIDFDTLRTAYAEQIDALIEGGVDLLLFETAFDTLNIKAGLTAAEECFAHHNRRLPIMLSATIADQAGRLLSGQTLDAMIASIKHFDLFSIGLNCSFGAKQMAPYLKEIASLAPCYITAHPNAGIPDAMGNYTQSPDEMARDIAHFIDEGWVNIVGGCCGSTPDHIRAIAAIAERHSTPHRPNIESSIAWLAGLDGFRADGHFINVGERCNVAGSRKFLRLIKEKSYDEALAIARQQVADGAMMLDINMDDAMLDAQEEMCHFLNLMASDPDIARLPWMIDSSRFEVIEAGLKTIQGKAIVNSLSLKEGEELFLRRAQRIKELGAAVVVMAFDEQGQATSFERRIEICQRAYNLLVDRVNFSAEDIIFDPNILTIATGIKEHDGYALDFIRATEWIHDNLPYARVSGGVSNLSFALRGNNFLREAMHAVFLYHAINAGMDMAIVNPSAKVMYADIPAQLLEALEDVILCRREDATERLLAIAKDFSPQADDATTNIIDRTTTPLEERLSQALRQGDDRYLEEDLTEALSLYPTPTAIIEGPLMRGMGIVGELFGKGKMFLPQVVKTARTMKRAVDILQPHIEASQGAVNHSAGCYLLATVKGDVHDIGKNIVGVILACNNFEVIDLGVMVSAETIVQAALAHNVDFIGLSGLITPSLDEMCNIAQELARAGIEVPLFIGGATTSALHTAVKIAPLYNGVVVHVKDAAQNPILAMTLLSKERNTFIEQHTLEQAALRSASSQQNKNLHTALPRLAIDWAKERFTAPSFVGVRTLDNISIDEVRPFINMRQLCNLWHIKPESAEAQELICEADKMLDDLAQRHHLAARVGFFEAFGDEECIVVKHGDGCSCCTHGLHRTTIHTPRQTKPNNRGVALSLCDFVAPVEYHDHIGVFAITISPSFSAELSRLKSGADNYSALMMQGLGDRLVEAASEWLHAKVRRELWGYAPEERASIKELFAAKYQGIRPAVGYPSLPDQKTIFPLIELLSAELIGISLTENGAMMPQSSVCGLYIANRHAQYFVIEP